jgi:hypothetical protein
MPIPLYHETLRGYLSAGRPGGARRNGRPCGLNWN